MSPEYKEIARLNERLAKAEKRANDAWAAARMEQESAEYWKKQAEEAKLSAALHENAAGHLAQMAVDSVSGGPSREEVIEQCAEAVNLVRFNEAALHRKALTKAIEAIRALASTTATPCAGEKDG
jgi:squalene cyclase